MYRFDLLNNSDRAIISTWIFLLNQQGSSKIKPFKDFTLDFFHVKYLSKTLWNVSQSYLVPSSKNVRNHCYSIMFFHQRSKLKRPSEIREPPCFLLIRCRQNMLKLSFFENGTRIWRNFPLYISMQYINVKSNRRLCQNFAKSSPYFWLA